MTIEYEVKVDEESLAQARSLFEFIGGNSADAVRIAINKTGKLALSSTKMSGGGASQRIREQVRLKAGYVKDRLKFTKATRNSLSGAIRTPSRGILLSRYSTDTKVSGDKISWVLPPPTPPRGIKVKIKPNQPPKLVSGDTGHTPFYMVLKNSGRVAIAARRDTPGPQGGKIKVFHAPSLSQVFSDVKDDMMPVVNAEYTHQMADAMRYLLNKQRPR